MCDGIEVRGAWLPRRHPGGSAGYVVAQFERTDRVIEYARDLHEVYLDLSDPTSRAHAAWWCNGRFDGHPGDDAWKALSLACAGIKMTPEQIDTLARLVLRLAGRS